MKKLILSFCLFFVPALAWANAMEWANGNWGLDPEITPEDQLEHLNCKNSPIAIYVNPETKEYVSQVAPNQAETAKILATATEFIKIKYDGEERVMDNGELQIWNMLFLDKDKFVWVRQDWVADGEIKGATAARVRCDKPNIS